MAAHDTAWIGTWDLPKTRGADALTVCERDRATGALTPIRSLLPGVSVGAMHLDERRRVLYVTDEDTRHGADRQGAGGSVIALAVHDDGALVEIGRRPSYGSLPSYVAVDPTGGFLLVTNHTASAPVARLAGSRAGDYRMTLAYDTATTVLFPLGGDGGIGEPLDVLVHDAPAGPRPGQTHPRPHCVVASPSGAFFVVCDKGSDRILTIGVDADAGRIRPLAGDGFAAPPGSSPRYAAFHPTRPFLFVNHETAPIVSSFRHTDAGELVPIGTADVLLADGDGAGARQSDLRVHPSGAFVFSLVRGDDSVCVLAVDEASGSLRPLHTVRVGAAAPRGCAISPDGAFLYIASAGGDEVSAWRIDAHGGLTPAGAPLRTPAPGAIVLHAPRADTPRGQKGNP